MRKIRHAWDTNRDMARTARHAQFWCGKCDAQIVGAGQTCPYCGGKPDEKRLKKPYPPASGE